MNECDLFQQLCHVLTFVELVEPCVFPFMYAGKTYYHCTRDWNENYYDPPWCATKVNDTGHYEAKQWRSCLPQEGMTAQLRTTTGKTFLVIVGLFKKVMKLAEEMHLDPENLLSDLECSFPFDFNGETIYDCTFEESYSNHCPAWCATELDSNGEFVKGNWKYCALDYSDDC